MEPYFMTTPGLGAGDGVLQTAVATGYEPGSIANDARRRMFKPWVQVGKASRRAMAVFSLKGKNTGAAVVVFPEGSTRFSALSTLHLHCYSLCCRGRTDGVLFLDKR